MYEFKLADLGEGMHEAEIVQWLINVGDTTKLDQAIAKVETDKAVVELPSPVAGRVSEIRFKDGETAKVGDVLVVFTGFAGGGGRVYFDVLLDADHEPILRRTQLDHGVLARMHWDSQSSGVLIPEEVAQRLEVVWAQTLRLLRTQRSQ